MSFLLTHLFPSLGLSIFRDQVIDLRKPLLPPHFEIERPELGTLLRQHIQLHIQVFVDMESRLCQRQIVLILLSISRESLRLPFFQ